MATDIRRTGLTFPGRLLAILLAAMLLSAPLAAQSTWQQSYEGYNTARAEGRYQDALDHAREALRRAQSEVGANTPTYGALLGNLATLYDVLGQPLVAERTFLEAIGILEAVDGADKTDKRELAVQLNNLAGMYLNQNREADALPLFRRAAEILEETAGADHPYTAGALSNLAGAQARAGDVEAAERHYRRAIAIVDTSLGPQHPTSAMMRNRLARLFTREKRYIDAERLNIQALAALERTVAADHPSLRRVRADLDAVHRAMAGLPPAAPEASAGAARPAPVRNTAPAPAPPRRQARAPDPPASVRARSAGGTRYAAQIGSLPDRAQAERELEAFRDLYPDPLKAHPARIQSKAIEGRGTWHRIQVGEFASRREAGAVCRALARQGHDQCIVARLAR